MMKSMMVLVGGGVMLWLVYEAKLHSVNTEFPVCEQAQLTKQDQTRCYQTQWWWDSAV